jgi:hypothetical protein
MNASNPDGGHSQEGNGETRPDRCFVGRRDRCLLKEKKKMEVVLVCGV